MFQRICLADSARRARGIAGLFLLLWCFGASHAQSDYRKDPAQLLRDSTLALRRITSVEYVEKQMHAGDKVPHLEARVRQARANVPDMGLSPGMYLVQGTAAMSHGKMDEFAYSYNGAAFRVMDRENRVVQVVKAPTPYIAGQLLSYRGIIGFPQFTKTDAWAEVLKEGRNFLYGGLEVLNGVECHVLSFERDVNHPSFGKRSVQSRWWIGKEDLVPRGVEINGVRRLITITGTNHRNTPADYYVPLNEGFSERLVTGKEPRGGGLLATGSIAPDWTLNDPSGKPHSLKDFRGRLVVIDFWGTWCAPCLKTMPVIQQLHERYGGKGITFIGISVADEEADPAAFMRSKGFTYRLLVKGDDVARSYNAIQLPTLYVIGGDGRILHAEFGLRGGMKDDLVAIIEKYIKEAR